MIPDNYIQRVIQFARQGYTGVEFPIFDTDWDSDAYMTVSGQNSNNSVRLNNAFLEAVLANGDWSLVRRTDGKIAKSVKARDLWEQIGHAAWACADPGLQFDTTINEWHTCPESGRINASNPCSEYMFLDDTACNLASLNLLPFQRADGTFDVGAFEHAARLCALPWRGGASEELRMSVRGRGKMQRASRNGSQRGVSQLRLVAITAIVTLLISAWEKMAANLLM